MTTNLGALTTAFTPPASCATSTGIHIVSDDNGQYWAAGPVNLDLASECYPPDYNPTKKFYYSPGICPSGYTPACTRRSSLATLTETIYTCCPSNSLGLRFVCMSTWAFPWQSTLNCDVSLSDVGTTRTWDEITMMFPDRIYVTSTERMEAGIGAYGIEVRFQANDLEEMAAGSTAAQITSGGDSTTGQPSPPSTGSGAQLSQPTGGESPQITQPGADNGNGGSGLSVGASVGIGIGAAAGFIALVGVIGFLFWKRRRASKKKYGSVEMVHEAGDGTPGTGAPPPKMGALYAGALPSNELSTIENKVELPGSRSGDRFEMST